MEMKINIKRCFYELWKRKRLVALIGLLSILAGVFMMLNMEEKGNYSATASVYSMIYGSYGANEDSQSGGSSSLSEFSEFMQSSNVAKRAATILDNPNVTEENIQYMYTMSTSGNFNYIYSYADDKQLAVDVANAVADAFVVEYKNLTGKDDVQAFEKATDAQYYSGDATNKKLTLLIYTGVGLFLICVILVLRVIFSAKVQDYSECTMDGEIELLGVIPEEKE